MSQRIIQQTNGTSVNNTPVTTAIAAEYAPGLLLNEIDRRVTRIHPTSTPIDQISRLGGARRVGAMKVEYYSAEPKESRCMATKISAGATVNGARTWKFTPSRPIFEVTDTMMVPEFFDNEGRAVILYVVNIDENTGEVIVVPNTSEDLEWPIDENMEVVRMGRAAGELDVQTAQYGLLPVKRHNFCQIFKMQVEESTYQKIANKEVGWTFSDQEEAAISDMRLGMEKSFLFGVKSRIYDPRKREQVYLTGGIWNQASSDFSCSSLTKSSLVDMMKAAFTNKASSSSRKILVGGSDFISALSKIDVTKVSTGVSTFTRWGIEFDEIRSNFGTLLVKHSEVFDICGHGNKALILDPEYLTKYVHVPFSTERLDLRKSGQRNTDAVVVTEASCLVLRHPTAHMRVTLD